LRYCDGVKLAQETLEGELYITGSRVVAILENIRVDLILTRLEWADSEKGTRVLTSVIETRVGDGSNACEVDCEGTTSQFPNNIYIYIYLNVRVFIKE